MLPQNKPDRIRICRTSAIMGHIWEVENRRV